MRPRAHCDRAGDRNRNRSLRMPAGPPHIHSDGTRSYRELLLIQSPRKYSTLAVRSEISEKNLAGAGVRVAWFASIAGRIRLVGDLYDNFAAPVRCAFEHLMSLTSLIEPQHFADFGL